LKEMLFNLTVSVVANVLSYYICKYLDGNNSDNWTNFKSTLPS